MFFDFRDTDVLVSVGPVQLLGVIRFADTMKGRLGRWFGVEIKTSPYFKVDELIRGGDAFPCASGWGLYVTISALRLAGKSKHASNKYPRLHQLHVKCTICLQIEHVHEKNLKLFKI